MGKSVPSPPPQPDPKVVAAAQTGSNIVTAQGNSILGNANQVGPYGSTTFTPGQNYSVVDQDTGKTWSIPQWTQTTTLTPAQQQLLDQQNQLGAGLNQLALDQTGRISGLLGQPIQAPSGSIQRSVPVQTVNPTMAPTTFGQTAGNIQYDIGGANWDKATNAILDRLNPQIAQDRAAQETKLANMGFTPTANMGANSDAYQTAMDQFGRQANDARTQAILSGFDVSKGIGEFNNNAQQQDYSQLLGRGQFAQQGTMQNNAANLNAAQLNNQSYLNAGQFANSAYGQDLQTMLALRNQPINEISALMNGGQVNLPQFAGYQGGTVNPTPIGDYYMQNAQIAAQNYQAQLQAQSAQTAGLYSGLSSVAGMGLYGLAKSDRRIKTDIERIGTWINGLPIYLFRFIGERLLHIGFMAQDVEQVKPEAVVTIGGIKHVNYPLAMRS